MMASYAVLLLTLGWLLRSSIRGEAHTLSLSFHPFNLFSICVHTLSFLLLFLQLPLLSLSLISSSCSQTHSQYLSLPFILSSSLSYLPPSLPPSLSLSCWAVSSCPFHCPHISNYYHVQYVLYLSFKAKFIWPAVLLIEGFIIIYSVYTVHYAIAFWIIMIQVFLCCDLI